MKLILGLSFLCLSLLITGCTTTQRGFPPDHQIVNFDIVDGFLRRGAQPNHQGFAYLKSIGVACVVNLRNDPLPDEKATVEALGMCYVSLPMSGTMTPTKAQMDHVLAVIGAQTGPVFIHCQFGCDRTGAVAASWRIRKDSWSASDALAEAKAYGLSAWLPNFHSFIANFR